MWLFSHVAYFRWEKFEAPISAGVGSWIRDYVELSDCMLRLSGTAGWDSSITEDEKMSELSWDNAKISVVSRDDEMINVRVGLPGKATQKVYGEALTSLARDAPSVLGFRKSKGGRTPNIPSSILPQMLGKSRVTKFVLGEILSITVGDFAEKENMKVNPEIKTTQSEGELESSFTPGSAFGFNVILQLEKKSNSDEACFRKHREDSR